MGHARRFAADGAHLLYYDAFFWRGRTHDAIAGRDWRDEHHAGGGHGADAGGWSPQVFGSDGGRHTQPVLCRIGGADGHQRSDWSGHRGGLLPGDRQRGAARDRASPHYFSRGHFRVAADAGSYYDRGWNVSGTTRGGA